MMSQPKAPQPKVQQHWVEWQTALLFGVTLAIWALATTVVYRWSPVLGVVLTGYAIAQYSSLQHEALHGHPFRNNRLNELIASLGIGLTVPFGRFRDTHLAHHHDPLLTDPYDDPESCYLDPKVWQALPFALKITMKANNTLLGRVVLGPLIGNFCWLREEARLLRAGGKAVRRDWALHILGLMPVLAWLWGGEMGVLPYLSACWFGHGLLKIRTFLEHRAHSLCRARTVIIEDRGILAFLFLNNNLHAVHHMHPHLPWYQLPKIYAENKDHYLRRTEGYIYRSYGQIFAQYLFRCKEPVAHPLFGKQEQLDTP